MNLEYLKVSLSEINYGGEKKVLSHVPVYYQPAMTYSALNLNGQHNTQHSHFHHVDLSFYFGFNLLHYCNKTKENKREEKNVMKSTYF